MARNEGRRSESAATVVALTIAGSDSSAGAGIQADLKTFSALGVYGLTAVTCVVAETPGLVSRIEGVSAGLVRDQIEVVLKSFPVAAIKTGLLFSAEIVSEIARTLRGHAERNKRTTPLVIDPVMVATSGDLLLAEDAIASYERELFPLAALLTPNLGEAARLLGETIDDLAAMRGAGQKLVEKYRVPVLLKGGHLTGDNAIDLLFASGEVVEFSAPFSRGIATHGTGCTYSAAITAGLATGLPLEESIRRAKKFVTATIAQHYAWDAVHALNHSPQL
ncbi:MAG TPA: bifunctional hydroxymethylpyrimidine kinase/phosphomethylpyrimidine kinase [Chthoniobacterales bacterium]|nr:bifunctional hydroxymethylpyrimidine kinase/phosphomethylpyrimidine kinase [Chthoniobacterales bacterium]